MEREERMNLVRIQRGVLRGIGYENSIAGMKSGKEFRVIVPGDWK